MRRNTELGLIVLVVVITGSLYALAALGTTASLPADIVPFLGIVLALVVVAHVANRKLAPNADGLLLPLAAILNGIGYVTIARIDESLASKQAGWVAAGIGLYVLTLASVRSIRTLERYRYTFAMVGIGLLLLPLVPYIGRSINGARIWVALGPASFQPAEFAKIVLAVFFASYLVEKRELLGMATFRLGPLTTPDPRHLGPVVLSWGLALVVVIFEKDLGTALLFFVVFAVVLWVGTGRASYVAFGGVLFAAGAWFSYSQFSHVQRRVTVWLDPWADPTDSGYQIVQATYSLAWGGVAGTGPGLGIANRVPYDETDFIFAFIGEELGLLGAAAVIMSYLLILGCGLRIATQSTDPFSKLLAVGLTTLISVQSFIIIGGVLRVLPLTGVTLPFVSYGGSSLVANYVLLALLVRISDESTTREQRRAGVGAEQGVVA